MHRGRHCDNLAANVGAFPRDPMDTRLLSPVVDRTIDPTHWSQAPADDADDFNWDSPPVPYLDSDDDGMPDDWEVCNRLDPAVQGHTGKGLPLRYTGVAADDNLEVFFNCLADSLVEGAYQAAQPYIVSAQAD